MAEVNTAEVEANVEAAFLAGGSTPPVESVKVVEQPVVDPVKAEPVVPAPAPEKPQYIRVTKQEWDNAKASLGKVSTLESRVAKFEGAIPKTEQIAQQVLQSVRAQTPAGTEIDPQVLIDAFADQEKDFPELAAQNRKAIEHVLKNMRGTGTSAATALDTDEIKKAVAAELKSRDDAAVVATREKEMGGLQQAYPDWENIVGRPAPGTDKTSDTDWRKWATTHDKAALETDSPADVQASIAKFMESQKPAGTTAKPDKGAVRRAVIADAITPRADGGTPPIAKREDAEDAFSKAFKAVKRA